MLAGRAFRQRGAGAPHDYRQEIVEVMRNSACQYSDTLQLLGLPEAFFGVPAVGDVHIDADEADGAALLAIAFE
jgi:hypothetical protein